MGTSGAEIYRKLETTQTFMYIKDMVLGVVGGSRACARERAPR